MTVNIRLAISLLGVLLIFNGVCMLLALAITKLFYPDCESFVLLASSGISIGLGGIFRIFTLNLRNKSIHKKEGYLIVTLGWIVVSASGAVPYMLDGTLPHFVDAFFESMSGYTTTGTSVYADVEMLSPDILMWRSFTQLIGGIGIIVLAVAILPFLAIGGMQLFMTETSSLAGDKLQPRIRQVAIRLVTIYLSLIVLTALSFWAAGMPLFDALNHSFPTIATGGFSIKNQSIAYYHSELIEWITIFFMFLGGINFTHLYFFVKGNRTRLFRDEEFKAYAFLILVFGLICGLSITSTPSHGITENLRGGFFTIVSSVTTTGFVTEDYSKWSPFLSIIILLSMFTGACAGSTSGGAKVIRHVVLFKNSLLEVKRQLHPSAIMPVRINGKAINPQIVQSVQAFIITYVSVFAISSVFICISGQDILTSMSTVATSMGNIGLPAYNDERLVYAFNDYAWYAKWVLSFDMLVGRLELFAVLILFTKAYWRKV